jgi:hypothetical protein
VIGAFQGERLETAADTTAADTAVAASSVRPRALP